MAVITRWSYKLGGRKARASTVILSINEYYGDELCNKHLLTGYFYEAMMCI